MTKAVNGASIQVYASVVHIVGLAGDCDHLAVPAEIPGFTSVWRIARDAQDRAIEEMEDCSLFGCIDAR